MDIFVLFIIIILLFVLYNITITKYFRKNTNVISYNLLSKFIQIVSENNFFMNYGYWDDENMVLLDANKKLIQYVFDKTELLGKKDMNILDVGCGYGEQDIEWSKQLDKTCKLRAVDISETQIYHAIEKQCEEKNSDVTFDICDALFIDKKYGNELFDVIISLESAFHYSDRPKFFKNASVLLKDNGRFVITDIMLKYSTTDIITNMVINIYSDFLNIPRANLITADEWEKQIASEFNIIESHDITEKTFTPYYNHYMKTLIKNMCLPSFLSDLLIKVCSVQPFSYRIAVCGKKNTV